MARSGQVVLGLPAACAGGRFLETLLFETSASDTATFIIVSTTLVLVAILATVIPVARAARTGPAQALRVE